VLPPEVNRWQRVEGVARRVFALYGMQEIRTPIFEDSKVFEKGTGEQSEIVQKEMYRFTDLGGHDLTLRPEGTPPVVRAYLEHRLAEGKDVTKLYYIGPMFRYERPQKGRYRQFHQIGAEVFGSEDPAVDAEVIEMAMFWLQELGVESPTLYINSVGDHDDRPLYMEKLLAAQRKYLADLSEDSRKRHEINPLRVFDSKDPRDQAVIEKLPKILDHLSDSNREHLDKVCSYLRDWGIEFQLEPRLVRGLDYYRRTVFEITSPVLGAQDSLLGGGRYDGLVQQMGGKVDAPAVGFASGVERIVMAMPEDEAESAVDCFVVTVDDSVRATGLDLMWRLRRAGIRTSTDYQGRSLKAQMRAANRSAAPTVVIVGPEEVESGKFTIKRMSDGRQVSSSSDHLANDIRTLLASEG
jgi:histidyl-tRNA synthetase